MSNMGYCRFENTHKALADCWEHRNDELSKEEQSYKALLIDACLAFLEDEGLLPKEEHTLGAYISKETNSRYNLNVDSSDAGTTERELVNAAIQYDSFLSYQGTTRWLEITKINGSYKIRS